eukprot:1184915-Prorocentrum_minimum.AAC.4
MPPNMLVRLLSGAALGCFEDSGAGLQKFLGKALRRQKSFLTASTGSPGAVANMRVRLELPCSTCVRWICPGQVLCEISVHHTRAPSCMLGASLGVVKHAVVFDACLRPIHILRERS